MARIAIPAILLSLCGIIRAATIPLTGYSLLPGAVFYDAPSNNVLASPTIGGVSITPLPPTLSTAFGAVPAPQYGIDVPGTGGGFGSQPNSAFYSPSLILDFGRPVAAFGVTVDHFFTGRGAVGDANEPFTFPVSVAVFSRPDGTGTLLGIVTDAGGGPAFADFIGLWSTGLDINSAVVSRTSNGGFAIDGYAISLTTQTPEPAALLMFGLGLGLVGLLRLLQQKRKR